MVKLTTLPDVMQKHLSDLDCPVFETQPWVRGGPLRERRIAVVSSAGIHRRDDAHFTGGDAGYRTISRETDDDLVMSHISINFDRTAFQQDREAIFPLKHLTDLADEGVIGSVAATHYSFMGATSASAMEKNARELAGQLKFDNVDSVVLLPV